MPVFLKLPGLAVPHSRAPPTGAPGNHRRKSLDGGGAGDGWPERGSDARWAVTMVKWCPATRTWAGGTGYNEGNPGCSSPVGFCRWTPRKPFGGISGASHSGLFPHPLSRRPAAPWKAGQPPVNAVKRPESEIPGTQHHQSRAGSAPQGRELFLAL